MRKKIVNLLAVIGASVAWRAGGAEGYSKLWRRIGSTACMSIIVWDWRAIPFIAIGCWSYFDRVNKWFKLPEPNRERWFNFAIANLFIQGSVLFVNKEIDNILFVIIFSISIALIKVWIDKKYPLGWKPRQDVVSEIAHGGLNALCLWINVLI